MNGFDPAMTADDARPHSSPTTAAPQGDVDTVEHAASTPDQAQPYADLGVKDDEYQSIREILGRRPTNAELAMYSVMWSEHCSYKSSKKHLRRFGERITEEMREKLLVGMGENAGVVDIGDGWAVTFKVESHNHPSYVEPYQGAATGVGGIVRDIISMGARPVAVMDQLRFGAIDHPDTARVVHGAVAGIGGYGNSLGLPNIGGETVFDPTYQRNPLVNALCLGVLRHEDLHLASATGPGNLVVLFGARTGGDGIGGASILASETFEEDGPIKRPSVQVGDPFMEKLLIECCLELFAADTVEGIQDLGAAGISCATSELAANGRSGMRIDLENVLLRDPSLNAGEILMSESQERMMAIVRPEKLAEFEAIAARWDVEMAVIGEVTDDDRLIIDHHGRRIVDVDPGTVAIDGPVYDRPYARPAWQDTLQADTAETLARPEGAEEVAAQLRRLIASPNLASPRWVTDQFDRYVGGNTALSMPDDAGVVRVDETTGRGVALATDANGRYAELDPRTGAQLALAEAYRNVATTGAVPLAVTDCLNFGSPEDPGPMWQLVEAIEGLSEACQTLGIPVTGGNVSLYNSTGEPGTQGSAIHPTPVVGVLGVFDDVSRRTASGWHEEGAEVFLLGTTREELSGSAWADVIHDHLGGLPPAVDLEAERSLAEVLIAASREGLATAAHDLSQGGLAQSLVECCTRFGIGAQIGLGGLLERDGVDLAAALFSESQARALVAVPTGQATRLRELCTEHDVPLLQLGTTGGTALELEDVDEFAVSDLHELREGTLPRYFG